MSDGHGSDRSAGWILAGMMFIHLLLLRNSSEFSSTSTLKNLKRSEKIDFF